MIYEEGWTITIVGWVIVIFALTLLFLVFTAIPKVINFFINKRLKKQGIQKIVAITSHEEAIIAAALFLYHNDTHDKESNIITVKKIIKKYSPWSSKIYNVIPELNRKF